MTGNVVTRLHPFSRFPFFEGGLLPVCWRVQGCGCGGGGYPLGDVDHSTRDDTWLPSPAPWRQDTDRSFVVMLSQKCTHRVGLYNATDTKPACCGGMNVSLSSLWKPTPSLDSASQHSSNNRMARTLRLALTAHCPQH